MKKDPFVIKKYQKWHPIRLVFTIRARLIEQEAKLNFHKYALPEKIISDCLPAPDADYKNTAVTPVQMQHLVRALRATEHLTNTVAIEVGCYRGITTQVLSRATSRKVIAIDPYIGYGGSDEDYRHFQDNVAGLSNVIQIHMSSGEAFRNWKYGPVSFVFIDALHDYVNTAFDIEVWSSLLVKGGIIAMHDTDQYRFAGTRKAVFKAFYAAEQFAHPENLVLVSG